ncbi:hypothetical protein KGY79_07635 [Candidatus Bipolaricaulota bacterium]|nr:hypothetical protein [Candidatus Bipolaricaulota bacterium]
MVKNQEGYFRKGAESIDDERLLAITNIDSVDELLEHLEQVINRAEEFRELKKKAEGGDSAGGGDGVDPLKKLLEDGEGKPVPPTPVDLNDRGAVNITELAVKLGDIEYWIRKKSELSVEESNFRLDKKSFLKRFWQRLTSPYRKLELVELLQKEVELVKQMNSLLGESVRRATEIKDKVYDKDIGKYSDVIEAGNQLEKMGRLFTASKLLTNRADEILEDIPSDHPEYFEIQKEKKRLEKYIIDIKKLERRANEKIDWLKKTRDDYEQLESIVNVYMSMLDQTKSRVGNLTSYAEDISRIAAGIKEGKELTDELKNAQGSLGYGVISGVGEIRNGITDIIENTKKISGEGTEEIMDVKLPELIRDPLSETITDSKKTKEQIESSQTLPEKFDKTLPAPGKRLPRIALEDPYQLTHHNLSVPIELTGEGSTHGPMVLSLALLRPGSNEEPLKSERLILKDKSKEKTLELPEVMDEGKYKLELRDEESKEIKDAIQVIFRPFEVNLGGEIEGEIFNRSFQARLEVDEFPEPEEEETRKLHLILRDSEEKLREKRIEVSPNEDTSAELELPPEAEEGEYELEIFDPRTEVIKEDKSFTFKPRRNTKGL